MTENVAEARRTRRPAVAVRDLVVRYETPRGAVTAVDGVSLAIERGGSLGLVGESGCGKTSLGRALIALLPDTTVTAGSVEIGGMSVLDATDDELRWLRSQWTAFVFQDPATRLDPLMTVRDHFREIVRAHRPEMRPEDARRLAVDSLRAIRIPASRLRSYPHELSSGMRQRVMIALATALRPAVLVADEPTSSLDVLVEAEILGLLSSLVTGYRMALLLITHNIAAVARTCERIAVMYAGKIVESGETAALLKDPRHPYTKGLLAGSIDGAPPDLSAPPPGCRFHPRCPVAIPSCAEREPPLREVDGRDVACVLYE